ncbi:MAG: biotin/lipoyl-binding protein [Spirochaetes bacterium]|nr:biotin/lipoyl-binding protein [Spirochaetota bacterium]
MEAMKMETEIFAPCAGTVTAINVSQGDQKTAGAVLAVISPAGQSYAQPAAPAAPAIQAPQAQAPAAKAPSPSAGAGSSITAPMPGLILRIEKQVGDTVAENELVLVMEAMKMETEIFAPCAGTIASINVAQGDQKKAGDLLAVISQA